ncbi:hypothetical protein M2360_000927 [Rhizobium sp. SG_E_25_P2]|uniref:phage tail tube protein n=1 Tax=Rhizobium sp. SG_E_25_P2 TaxID=2879942 RepID=UPI002476382E|nr:phage tail tube protein [Rhizobium sp. SG_E_25_P2]MDH6265537.1 hypothetical protein [Rhizobium sp. SG_E_25_P2]
MTAVKTMNGTSLLVQISDGGSPESFVHDCLVNAERSIQFSSDGDAVTIPDCDEPDKPGWKEQFKDGLQATIEGAGMLHTASVEKWFDWFRSGDLKRVRVRVDVTAANGGGYWAGDWHLMSFGVSGARKSKSQVSLTLMSSGPVSWTDAT